MSDVIPAIDVHAHYGRFQQPHAPEPLSDWLSASAAEVVRRASAVDVQLTVVSPLAGLMPRGQADAGAANEAASKTVSETPGLRQWVVLHPHQLRTFDQVSELLAMPHCVGIKIHPEEHQYPIREHGERLFELAASHDAVILAHSGDPLSWPQDFVPFANEYPNVRLILAHLGNGGGAAGDPTLQVRAIQQCRHDNVFVDTSSSRSVLPGLIEWAVSEIGAERILFGTDTPWYVVRLS